MAHPLRIHVPGALYHVTLRGNHRQDIFFTPADRALFVALGTEALARFGARLHGYCLMTNHLHPLVVQVEVPARLMFMETYPEWHQLPFNQSDSPMSVLHLVVS